MCSISSFCIPAQIGCDFFVHYNIVFEEKEATEGSLLFLQTSSTL